MVPVKQVLIVIDMQNDFVTGILGSEAAAAIVPAVRALVEEFQSSGRPVVFTLDTHSEADYTCENQTEESRRIPRHCVEGSEGWRLVPELRPLAGAAEITKPAFLCETLADEIRVRFGSEVDLLLCGVCTDICVVSNALALRAAFPHSRIAVRAGCCAGTTTGNHEAALAVMRSCLVDTE